MQKRSESIEQERLDRLHSALEVISKKSEDAREAGDIERSDRLAKVVIDGARSLERLKVQLAATQKGRRQ